jgi:hypothetical protein
MLSLTVVKLSYRRKARYALFRPSMMNQMSRSSSRNSILPAASVAIGMSRNDVSLDVPITTTHFILVSGRGFRPDTMDAILACCSSAAARLKLSV